MGRGLVVGGLVGGAEWCTARRLARRRTDLQRYSRRGVAGAVWLARCGWRGVAGEVQFAVVQPARGWGDSMAGRARSGPL